MVEGDEPHIQPERSSVVFGDPMGHNGEEWMVISISPNITRKRYFSSAFYIQIVRGLLLRQNWTYIKVPFEDTKVLPP